jgi:hypothetical protein
VVLEEWRQHRDATGRMQEAYWSLLTSGSRVSQANRPDPSLSPSHIATSVTSVSCIAHCVNLAAPHICSLHLNTILTLLLS